MLLKDHMGSSGDPFGYWDQFGDFATSPPRAARRLTVTTLQRFCRLFAEILINTLSIFTSELCNIQYQ
jgi:hypothetical protein